MMAGSSWRALSLPTHHGREPSLWPHGWQDPSQWLSPSPPVNWTRAGTWHHAIGPIGCLVTHNMVWPRKKEGPNQISGFEGMNGETQKAKGNQQWPHAMQNSGGAEAPWKQGKPTIRETMFGFKNGEGIQSLRLLWTHFSSGFFSSSRGSSVHTFLKIKISPFSCREVGEWGSLALESTGT